MGLGMTLDTGSSLFNGRLFSNSGVSDKPI